jgi:hypothetical protein
VSAPDDTLQPDVAPRGNRAQAMGVFFVFLLVGPPLVALIVLAIGLVDRPSFARVNSWGDAGSMLLLALFFCAVSYLVMGLQAATMGLVAAFMQYRSPKHRVPLMPVLGAAFVTGTLFLLIAGGTGGAFTKDSATDFVGLHLAAAIGCWLIANGLLRRSGARGKSVGT